MLRIKTKGIEKVGRFSNKTDMPKSNEISLLSRWLVITSILFLTLSLFFPLWYIRLDAPQYPEGLVMKIWVNKISGDTEYTLDNINLLNHYIGMKKIIPESIPELKWMPYILSTLIFFGFIVISFRKKHLLTGWVILLATICIIGLIDFYKWEYDYGHNLDPDAPLKLLDSYQPPLIGKKQILNITAQSLPSTGGIMIIFSLLLGLIAIFIEIRKFPKNIKHNINNRNLIPPGFVKPTILVFIISLFSYCSIQLEEIQYGKDACDFCKMNIVDNRYGAELVSDKGKVYKFDSVECMLNFLKVNGDKDFKYKLVTHFDNPGKLEYAEQSSFLITENLPSPMRGDINAFSDIQKANEFQKKYGGKVYRWEDLLKMSFE